MMYRNPIWPVAKVIQITLVQTKALLFFTSLSKLLFVADVLLGKMRKLK